MSHFNYCSLFWTFSSVKSLEGIENIQKKSRQFLLKVFVSTHKDLKTDRSSFNVNRLQILYVKIYKTVNNLNPDCMKEMFALK